MGRSERAATASSVAVASARAEPPHYPFRPVRTRALQDLESSPALPKLLALVAPMGYGKTVLMSELYARLDASGEPCYWTTLDERSGRLEDLLERLEAHSRDPRSRAHPTQALFRGEETRETRIENLVRAANHGGRRYTVFIDNLHFCTDPLLGTLLDRLMFETPAHARFVITSTAALPGSVARAKLEGRLRQIGPAELSLDLHGVAELLGPRICEALGPEKLEDVLHQTEGWPAAARMMQIVMSGSRQPQSVLAQFSGSDEDLVALLNRQVLRGLPDDVREFLLAIAPLHSFDAALCGYVCDSGDVQVHLDWLIRHNVFMVPLDRARQRHRLHGLFRQFLLAEARRHRRGEHLQKSLTRAAQWCESQGLWRDAMEYALQACDLDTASRVVERSAQALVRDRGDIPAYIEWVRALLEQGVSLGIEAEYWYVWALALNQHYDDARHHLERLVRRIERRRETANEVKGLDELERRLEIIRLCIEVFTDRLADADRMARVWLADAHGDDPFDITVARCIRSIHSSSVFEFVQAREAVQAALSSASQTGSDYAKGWIVALSTLPAVLEGQYAQAYPALQSALGTLPATLGDTAGICGTIALLAGTCATEMGRDDEARALIDQGLLTAHSHGFIDAVASGLDAALKLWLGTAGESVPLARVQQIIGHYPLRLAFIVSCHRVRRWVRLGRLTEAQAEASNIGLSSSGADGIPSWAQGPRGRDAYFAAFIDLQLATGKGRSVAPLIAEQLLHAKADGRVARVVDLELAYLQIELGENRRPQAVRHLSRAISLAASRRIVRPFTDLGAILAPLVEDTKPTTWGFAQPGERKLFGELCARLPIGDPSLRERLVSLNIDAHLRERLTPRESEMLALLEAGLTNQQIADRLDRKLPTIKDHLFHLYAKLGASNRAAALARARVLKLL